MRGGSAIRARPGASCGVTLDSFAASIDRAGGVALRELSTLDTLDVRTRNSTYRIHVIDVFSGDAVISGGAYFPVNTRVTIAGATFGGSMLKSGVVQIGCCLEIHAGSYRVTTTRVRAIAVNPARVAREFQ